MSVGAEACDRPASVWTTIHWEAKSARLIPRITGGLPQEEAPVQSRSPSTQRPTGVCLDDDPLGGEVSEVDPPNHRRPPARGGTRPKSVAINTANAPVTFRSFLRTSPNGRFSGLPLGRLPWLRMYALASRKATTSYSRLLNVKQRRLSNTHPQRPVTNRTLGFPQGLSTGVCSQVSNPNFRDIERNDRRSRGRG
jgi:hypothetical protein